MARIERGLAIIEVRANDVGILDPAPQPLSGGARLAAGEAEFRCNRVGDHASRAREAHARLVEIDEPLRPQPGQHIGAEIAPQQRCIAPPIDALVDTQAHQQQFIRRLRAAQLRFADPADAVLVDGVDIVGWPALRLRARYARHCG